jgi:hypothetical protein
MSSGLLGEVGRELGESAVPVRVVGGLVLPAAPEDAGPGVGEDAGGMGVAAASCPCPLVAVTGPGVGSWSVLGPIDQRGAEVLVAAAAEGDAQELPDCLVEGTTPAAAVSAVGSG